ncbi:hypothetical protein BH18CHL2_BH18CHL2_04310 [soil metagenome]
MSRARLAVVALAVATALLWQPVLRPAGSGVILLLDVYSPTLVGTNLAERITPVPRVAEETAAFAGVPMRVTWWRPGWGDAHPGVMLVNGATPAGNDNPATRQLGAALARAGYLVMLPELPFLKEGRFDVAATAQIDGAYAGLRARPEAAGKRTGVFGFSVGGGVLLAAAGREPALRQADYLAVLGAYYDLDTYLASVASASQFRAGRLEPWVPSDEARERLPAAAIASVPAGDAQAVSDALGAATHEEALRRLRALPPSSRAVFDGLSPETVWQGIRQSPLYWLHDPDDTFEPLAEAEAAAAAPREGSVALLVPRLVSHAAPSPDAAARGALFVAQQLWELLSFTMRILRDAGS